MPFKSKAQMRKLAMLMKLGKFSEKKFKEFASKTPSVKNLPEKKRKKK